MVSPNGQQVSRLLTQLLLNRKFMPTTELREVVDKLNTKFEFNLDISRDKDLDKFIESLNLSLGLLHMKIVQTRDESTGERVVVLCNTLDSDLSRHPEFNEQQMAVFRQIVHKIATSPEGCITHREAINSILDIQNCQLNEMQAESVIKKLVQQKYLENSSGERIVLSPVAVIELEPYLTSLLENEVVKCVGCRSLCLQGVHCSTASCSAKMHRACLEKVTICQQCKHKWK